MLFGKAVGGESLLSEVKPSLELDQAEAGTGLSLLAGLRHCWLQGLRGHEAFPAFLFLLLWVCSLKWRIWQLLTSK